MFNFESKLYRAAKGITTRLGAAGHQALLAGGCVRDGLLGRGLKDIDIATSARPEEVERIFAGETHAVGKAFGVIVVHADGMNFEVATFRADGEYLDGRRPASVEYADAAADAERRDFTINGLFYDPATGEVLDFVGGRRDLEAGIVRAIGVPEERFAEDSLRLMRAVRFAAVLEFEIEELTAAAIGRCADGLKRVSAERIGQEFTRILTEAARPSRALELLYELGLLRHFLPEVVALRGTRQQPEYHPEGDVWTHTLMMLDMMPEGRSAGLAYGVLLHDIGKPATTNITVDESGKEWIRSPGHAAVGARMVPRILGRLKLTRALREHVTELVARHMSFPDLPKMRPAKLRRFIGAPTFMDDLELHRLDCSCSSGGLEYYEFAKERAAQFASEPVLPEPWLMGRDLLALGMEPGPAMGKALARAYEEQLDGVYTSREEMLAAIRSRPS